jgi:hypothetical protein
MTAPVRRPWGPQSIPDHRVNRTAFPLILSFCCSLSGIADVPRLPFSGVYGATSGSGSLTGWERHGGDNPAVVGEAGWSASAAGYAPFGLDGLRVMELDAARDARRWGVSLGGRFVFDDGGSGASRWSIQGAWKPHERLGMGGSLRVHAGHGNPGIGAGLGILWHPYTLLSLGAAWETSPGAFSGGKPRQDRAGIGADFGTRLGARAGYAARTSVEYVVNLDDDTADERVKEWRFGAHLRFHALLSVYAGLAPRHQTVALGVRFGMGDWEGFSALRRHAALGGTSIQGVRWRRGKP